MKISALQKSRLLLLGVAVGAISMTGCKALSWKPTGKLFSWGRQPETETLELPESPATKYTPNAISSDGVGTASGSDATIPTSSAYGYTAGTQGTGLAAKANGFQTGPYQVGGTGTKTSPYKAASSIQPASTSGYPNPYGGNYGQAATGTAGSSSKNSEIKLPKSVQGILAANKTSPAPAAGIPVSGAVTNPYSAPNLPSYPSLPSSNLPTGVAGASASSRSASSSFQGATTLDASTGTLGSAATTGMPRKNTTPGLSTAGTERFAPGTTGRPTQYDFSK